MSQTHTGNVVPSITQEEHRSVGGVNAKATFQYSLPLDAKIDSTVTNVTYVGKAGLGSATSGASWLIKKIDSTVSNVVTITWASNSYNQIWDNRASLSYT